MIELLDWDTDFFGIKCGRIILSDNEILDRETLVNSKFDFITILNLNNNQRINENIASSYRIHLADIRVKLNMEIDEKQFFFCDDLSECEDLENGIFDQLVLISDLSFHISRFSKDKYLDQKKVKKMYRIWIKKAILEEDKKVYYTQLDNKVTSFIVLSVNNKSLDIELIATAPGYYHRGFAEALINKAYLLAEQMKISRIKVTTQADNIAAMNLYTRKGFVLISVDTIYHYHKSISLGRQD